MLLVLSILVQGVHEHHNMNMSIRKILKVGQGQFLQSSKRWQVMVCR